MILVEILSSNYNLIGAVRIANSEIALGQVLSDRLLLSVFMMIQQMSMFGAAHLARRDVSLPLLLLLFFFGRLMICFGFWMLILILIGT